MISFQVEQVDAGFADLLSMESSGWVPATTAAGNNNKENAKPKKRTTTTTKKKVLTTTSKPPTSSLREMMAMRRKEMQQTTTKENNTLHPSVAVSASSPIVTAVAASPNVEKVFEGGFFSVRSPLRTPNSSEGGAKATRAPLGAIKNGGKLNFD